MPRFRPGAYHRRGAGRASTATPEFLKQVEELKRNRDVEGLSRLISRTNRPEKIEPAAKALGEIGTSEAKVELLTYLVTLNPKSEKIWPCVLPLLGQEDVPELLEHEKWATRNPRKAAKYKLPVEAQEILVAYVKDHVSDASEETLRWLVTSRYEEVSDTTFELLLVEDSPDIRETLKALMGLTGDRRKSSTRPMLAFEELLTRTPAEEQKKLLTEAFGSYSVPVSRKAGKMLAERHPRYFVRIVRQKPWLNATDVQVLLEDRSPKSIARIMEEDKIMVQRAKPSYLPPKEAKERREKLWAIARALDTIGIPRSERARKSRNP